MHELAAVVDEFIKFQRIFGWIDMIGLIESIGLDWIGTLTFQFAILDFDEARGGDATAVEEGRMLESAGLLDADVEVVGCVGDLYMYVNFGVRKK